MNKTTTQLLLAAVAVALCFGSARADDTIYADDFSGTSTDALQGTTPDTTFNGHT